MRKISRSVLAFALLAGTFESAVAASSLRITDLSSGAPYASAVESLVQAGIVTGRSDDDGTLTGLFRPNDRVTLAEALKMSLLGAKQRFPSARVPSNVSAQGTWAAGYVSAAELRRFKVFKDNRLDVFRTATRTEVVQTLADAFHLLPSRVGTSNASAMTRGEFAVLLARLLPFAPASTLPVIVQAASSASSVVQPSPSVAPVPEPLPLPPPPPTMTDATHRLVATSANMRSGPSKEYRIVRVLFNGELMKIVSQPSDAWAEVELNDGTKGFLILSSMAPLPSNAGAASPSMTSGPTGTVTSAVNVRRKPDFTFPAFDSIPAGTTITILDDADPFHHVRLPDGREGYITKKFVKVGE